MTCSFENGLDISTTVSVGAIICSTGSTLKISNIKVYPEVEEVTYGWVDNGDDTITYTHSADLTDEQKQITIDMEQYEGDPSSIRYIGIPYERSSSNLEVSVTNGEFGTYGSNGMFYVLCPNGFSTEETFAVNLLGDVEDGAYITFDFRDAVTYDEGGIDAVGVWTYENGTYSYVHNGAEPYALKKHINLADHTDLDLTEIRSVSFDVTIDGINSGVGIWDGTDYQFVWCSASTDVKWNFPAGITGNGFFDVMPDIAEEGMTLTVSNIVVSSEASGYGWVNNGDGTLTYTHSSELTESQRKFNVDIREYYSGNYNDIRLIALPIESTGNSCAFNAEGATAHHCESNKNFVMYHYGMPSQSLVLYPSETDLENLADGTSFTLDIGSMNIYDTDNIDEVGTWTRDGDSYTYTHNGAELHGYELKINLADHYDGDLTDITGVSFAFTRTSNIFASAGLWDGSNYPYEWLDTDRNVTWSFDNGHDSDGIMTLSVYFAGGVGESVTFSDITIHTEAIEYGWKDNGDGTYTYVHSDKLTNAEKMTTIDFSEYYDGDLSKVRYVVVPAETNNDYMYVTFSDQTYGIFSTSTGSCIEFGNGISSSDMTLFMSNVSENITNGSYINFDFNNIRVYDVDTVKDIGVWTVDGNKFTYVNGSADEPFGLSCPFDLKKIIDGDLADVKAVNFEYEQNGNIYADAGMWDGSTYQWSIIGESWSENPVTWSIPNGIVNADGTGVLCGAGGTDAGASITITITADISPVGTWTDNGDGSYTYVHGDETCSGKDFTVPYAEIFDGDMSEIRSVTFDVEVKNSNATFSVGASDGNNCWQHQEFNAYDGFKQTVTMIMAYGARYDAGPNFQMWWIDAGAEITLSNFKVSAEDTGVKFNVRDYNETPLGTNADGSLDIELYTMSVSEYPRISLKGTDVVEAEVRLPSGVDSSQVYMGISISTADHTHISAYPSEKGVLSRSVSLKELADLVSISVEDITAVSVCVFNADGVITAEDKLGYTMTIRKGEDDDGTEIIYGWVINSDGIATYTHSNGLKEYDRQLNIDLSKYYDGDAADIRKVTIPYEASSDEITVFWCGSDTSKVNWTDTYSTAVFNGGRSSKDLTIAVCYAYTGLIDDISQIAEGTTLTVDLNNIVVEDVTDIDYGWVDNGDGTATYTHSASLTQEEREFTIDISKYYKGDLADAEKIYWSYVTSDENLRFFEGDNNKLWVGQYRAMYSYSEHGVGKTEIVQNVPKLRTEKH